MHKIFDRGMRIRLDVVGLGGRGPSRVQGWILELNALADRKGR